MCHFGPHSGKSAKNLTNFVHRCGRPHFFSTSSSTCGLSFGTIATSGTTGSIDLASCVILDPFRAKVPKMSKMSCFQKIPPIWFTDAVALNFLSHLVPHVSYPLRPLPPPEPPGTPTWHHVPIWPLFGQKCPKCRKFMFSNKSHKFGSQIRSPSFFHHI